MSHEHHQPRKSSATSTSTLVVLGGLLTLGVIGIVLGTRATSPSDASAEAPSTRPNAPSEAPRPPEPPRTVPQPAPQPKPASTDGAPLPAHIIADDTSLAPKRGRRIEVRVGEVVSPADCTRLVEKYRDRGGAEGQVSVSVEVKTRNGEKTTAPLCYDNMDGKGTQEGMGRQLIAATKATAVPLQR